MMKGRSASLARDLDQLIDKGTSTGRTDGELLRRFLSDRGDPASSAFEALVTRHGPTVLRVCRHILRSPYAAEDAFQATFLVLVRKAASIRVDDSLGPWLYSVAYRVAVRARADDMRRRTREVVGEVAREPEASTADPEALEVAAVLHEELDRLPEKYRWPIVLCHLEGKTHEEAATDLRWPVGTLSGRLSRARVMLRGRLSRRGLGAATPALLAVVVPRPSPAVPPSLRDRTVDTATQFLVGGSVPASILTLTRGVLTAMLWNRLRPGLVLASSIGALVVGAGYLAGLAADVDPPPAGKVAGPEARPKQAAAKEIPGFPKLSEQQKKPWRLDPRDTIPAMQVGSIVAVPSPEGQSWNALSLDLGDWQEYAIPARTKAIPVANLNVLALGLSGPDVREFAAFSGQHGVWSRQPLRKAAEGEFVPVVSADVVVYRVNDDFYAFAGPANRWDVLRLDGGESAKLQLGPSYALVLQGRTLHVFSGKRGRWSQGVAVKVPDPAKVKVPDPAK